MAVLMPLTHDERTELLHLARHSIERSFQGEPPEYPPHEQLQALRGLTAHRSAFVTLTSHGHLRGCVGTFDETRPLFEVVLEMARAAAFDDNRFPRLSESEWLHIEIEISALTPRERIYRPSDIEIGVHGLYVTKGWYHGVLLPQVATEFKWDVSTFLTETCLKAELPGDAWKPPVADGSFPDDIQIMRFKAEVFNEDGHA